ncbi:hypothetical protein C8J56DRAFT_793256 [Mycena floridula]|nr:hypothetical protein C8J56DRAFT_793256 [Mycena floridula]
MNKSRALALHSKYRNTPRSRDRLKLYKDIDRFDTSTTSSTVEFDETDGPTVVVNDLVASVVRCENNLFLCLGEVVDIRVESKPESVLPISMLTEKSVMVTFQLLFLVSSTSMDDPSRRNDWRTRRDLQPQSITVPGRLIQALNPPTMLDIDLFGSTLIEFSIPILGYVVRTGCLWSGLTLLTGQACFALESDTNYDLPVHDTCPACSPPVPIDNKRKNAILSHMGAHILFCTPDRSLEPCGLCLAPFPNCRFTGKGINRTFQVKKVEGCRNPISFKYEPARKYKASSPSTNVPVQCPKCLSTDPAVWKYNLLAHFKRAHSEVPLEDFEHLWEMSEAERRSMKEVWNNRHKVVKSRPRKVKGKEVLPPVISASHSSRVALR